MGELKVYVMPDGVKRQYREGEQPQGAIEASKPKPEKAPARKGK